MPPGGSRRSYCAALRRMSHALNHPRAAIAACASQTNSSTVATATSYKGWLNGAGTGEFGLVGVHGQACLTDMGIIH